MNKGSRILSGMQLALVGLLAFASVAQADGRNRTEVQTDLTIQAGFAGDAKARYRVDGGEKQFDVEVGPDGAAIPAGAVLTVTVDGTAAGMCTVLLDATLDTLNCDLSLNSDLGHPIPAVGAGSLVQVWTAGGALVAQGTF